MEKINKNIYLNLYTFVVAFLTLGWLIHLFQIISGKQTLNDNPDFMALLLIISAFIYSLRIQNKFLKSLKTNPKELFNDFAKSPEEALRNPGETQLLYNENGERVYFIDSNSFLKQNELVALKEFKNGEASIWVVQKRIKTLF